MKLQNIRLLSCTVLVRYSLISYKFSLGRLQLFQNTLSTADQAEERALVYEI
jgi:hypothetical protein